MTNRERFNRTMHFQRVDRVLQLEFGYWDETVERWRAEGLPRTCRPITHRELSDPMGEYLGLDIHWLSCFVDINNNSPDPAFAKEILDEDKETVTMRGEDGITCRRAKNATTVPQFIRFPVESPRDFDELKHRFHPSSPERYPDDWETQVKAFRHRDYPLGLNINGFFGQLRNWMGFENLAYAYHDQPDLIAAMCEFWADFTVEACRRVFEQVDLDFVHFWEDMSFNHGSMVSPAIFRRFMSPGYERVIECARGYGVDVFIVDSDGLLDELIPLMIEVGINGFLPVEIAAGNDPVAIRKKYPDLRLLGGIDKRVLAIGPDAIDEELARKMTFLVSTGGYIAALDHLVPPDVSLTNYNYYLKAKDRFLRSEASTYLPK